MKVDTILLNQLLREALQRAKITGFSVKEFQLLADKVNETTHSLDINDKYFYTAYKQCQIAIERGEKEIGLNRSYVNFLAKFCAYSSFDAFCLQQEINIDERLLACLGSWYSIARTNSGPAYLLLAPICIYEDGGRIFMRMKGKEREFRGEVIMKEGILYCTLAGEGEKVFHFVLRLKFARKPLLLQGIFSGISTGGEPIAGRELLWKWTLSKFDDMRHYKLPIKDTNTWPEWLDWRMAQYFGSYEQNCLKAGPSSMFNLDDLDIL